MTTLVTRNTLASSLTANTSNSTGAQLTHDQLDKNFFPIAISTNGTVEANKAVVVDANKDVTGLRNITMTGTLSGSTLTSPILTSGTTMNCQSSTLDNIKSATFIAEVAVGTGTTVTWTAGQKQSIAPTAASNPTYTFVNPTGPCNLTLKVTNGGAAGTITWDTDCKWPGGTAPTLTTSGTDIISFYFDGTNYYGVATLDFS